MKQHYLKNAWLGAAAVAIGLGSASAWAHHAATMFDFKQVSTFSGVVKQFEWTNPHSWLQVVARNGKGGTYAEWSLELGPSVGLWRSGWKPHVLKPGDSVTVSVHPLKDGSYGGRLISVTLPDGRVMNGQGGGPAPAKAQD